MRIVFCFVVLFLCAIPALAQQQSTTVELGAPTYSTQPQSKGYRWIVRGNLYPAGTYTPAPGQPLPRGVCDVPGAEVAPIGQYLISGQSGNAADHTATYVLRLEGRQIVFTGRLEVFEESPGIIGATLVEFRPPGVARFQPLRGIARFYRFRRPFGFLWMGGLRKGFRFHRTFDIE